MFNYFMVSGKVLEDPEITLDKEGRGRADFRINMWLSTVFGGGVLHVFCTGELAAKVQTQVKAGDCVVVGGVLYRSYDRSSRVWPFRMMVSELEKVVSIGEEVGLLPEK